MPTGNAAHRCRLEMRSLPPLARWCAAYSALALLLSGCTILPADFGPARAYVNKEALSDWVYENGSAVATASDAVPWCRDLRYPGLDPNKVAIFRQGYVRAVRGGAPSCPAAAGGLDSAMPRNDVFVALTLSSGGSRAAIFAAAVMFELQRYGLLREVDVISGVSGGALAAAFYARSCDEGGPCPEALAGPGKVTWPLHLPSAPRKDGELDPQRSTALEPLATDLMSRWLTRFFSPWSIFRYWWTYFDRSDLMAETYAAELFPDPQGDDHFGLRFRQLNPLRPNLLLNATNIAVDPPYYLLPYSSRGGRRFAFTVEAFAERNSDLGDYPLAFGVMASTAVPGLFHPVTLRDFRNARFAHLQDGGVYDRLGVEAIRDILERDTKRSPRPTKIVTFVVDSGIPASGLDSARPRAGNLLDRFVDSSALNGADALVDIQTGFRLESFERFVEGLVDPKTVAPPCCTVVKIRLVEYRNYVRTESKCPERTNDDPASLEPGQHNRIWCAILASGLNLQIAPMSVYALELAAAALVRDALAAECADRSLGGLLDCRVPDRDVPAMVPGSQGSARISW